jgi:hypothetical protein
MGTVQQSSAQQVAFGVVVTLWIITARWRGDDSAAALGPGLAVVVGAFGCEHVLPRAGADPLPAEGRAVRR